MVMTNQELEQQLALANARVATLTSDLEKSRTAHKWALRQVGEVDRERIKAEVARDAVIRRHEPPAPRTVEEIDAELAAARAAPAPPAVMARTVSPPEPVAVPPPPPPPRNGLWFWLGVAAGTVVSTSTAWFAWC